jgi:OmpA-OmpF porin, OOP family
MARSQLIFASLGAFASALLAVLVAQASGPRLADHLSQKAQSTIAKVGGTGIKAHFSTQNGWPTRHPLVTGGEGLEDRLRARTARAVSEIPGVGAVRWANSHSRAARLEEAPDPLHCQQDVEALLRNRTIRFREGSAEIEPGSRQLVDEVAAALRPCLGSIIAITGHTDNSGARADNVGLSRMRAEAVRAALIQRGIPADGLRTKGVGAKQPVPGLDPSDPANRRIEFSVIESVPVRPTPVDVPGSR